VWALLSTRIRTWLFIAVLLPLGRRLLHGAANRTGDSRGGRLLRRADTTLERSRRSRRNRP